MSLDTLREQGEALRGGADWRSRAVSAALAIGGSVVLGLAAWLEPAVAGHSTHTQLGLSPCTFLAWTGWPCPMCGATTTFALMAEGRVLTALVNQPFAVLLFVATIFVVAISAVESVRPTGRWRRIGERLESREGWLAAGVLVAMIAGWIWKAAAMSGLVATGI